MLSSPPAAQSDILAGRRPAMKASPRNLSQPGKRLQLWIVVAAAALLVLLAVLLRARSQRQAEALSAQYAALQRQTAYTADAFPCTVQFPKGFSHRVTSYDPFVFHGRRAELATCNDDVEGEVWAEFYALPAGEAAAAAVGESFADESHRLVRQRLAFLFDYRLPTEVDALHGKLQLLSQGEKDGWQVRLSYIPTPHGVGQVSPRQVPPAELRPDDIIAELPTVGIPANTLRPWVWAGIDDFRDQSERDAFRRAERQALERLKDQTREYQEARDRFLRMHRHFYLVEAAKALTPKQVVVLRRFGSIIDQQTPQSATKIIIQMMSALRCAADTPP